MLLRQCVFSLLFMYGVYTKEVPLKLLAHILNGIFVNNSRLFYYYPSLTNVDGLLANTKRSFYVASNLRVLQEDIDGYVLDFSAEANTLINKNRISDIKPHTRALIIFNETKSSSLKDFMMELAYSAVDVISADINCADCINLTFTDGKTALMHEEDRLDYNLFSFKPWKQIFRRPFRVGLFNCSPFVIYDERNEPNDGIEFNLMKCVTTGFPIEYVKINATGNEAFAKVRETVVTKNADLAVCALWMASQSSEEMDVIETIFPHGNICATFLVPKPSQYVGFLNPFLPLSANLWIAILLSISLMYLTLLTLSMTLPKLGLENINKSTAFLNVIRILSSGSAPKSSLKWNLTLKELLLPWSVTCMILTASYSAGITSTMNVPKYTKSIRTFSDVVEQQLKLTGVPKFIYHICENSNNPILTKLKDYFLEDTKYGSTFYGVFVKRMQGDYVINAEELTESQRSRFQILNECVMNLYLTILVPKNSPFKRYFDRKTTLLSQHGIIQAWKRNLTISGRFIYMKQFFQTNKERSYEYGALNIKEMKGAFLFLLCGFVLSAVVCLGEIFVKKRVDKQ